MLGLAGGGMMLLRVADDIVLLPSAPDLVGNRSIVLFTGVAPQTDLRAAADRASRSGALAGTRGRVSAGSVIHFTTSRARRGSLGIVRLQHLSGGRWSISFRESTRGLHSFRLVKPADSHHVNGHSHIVKIRVR